MFLLSTLPALSLAPLLMAGRGTTQPPPAALATRATRPPSLGEIVQAKGGLQQQGVEGLFSDPPSTLSQIIGEINDSALVNGADVESFMKERGLVKINESLVQLTDDNSSDQNAKSPPTRFIALRFDVAEAKHVAMAPNNYYLEAERAKTSEEPVHYLFYGLPEKQEVISQIPLSDHSQQLVDRFAQALSQIASLFNADMDSEIERFLGSTDRMVREGGIRLLKWRSDLKERIELKGLKTLEGEHEAYRKVIEFLSKSDRKSCEVSPEEQTTFIVGDEDFEPRIQDKNKALILFSRTAEKLAQDRYDKSLDMCDIVIREIAIDALTRRIVIQDIAKETEEPLDESIDQEIYDEYVRKMIRQLYNGKISNLSSAVSVELRKSLQRTRGIPSLKPSALQQEDS